MKFKKAYAMVSSIIFYVASHMVHAGIIYEYVGNDFTVAPDPFTLQQHVSVTFTLDEKLGNNLHDVSILDYDGFDYIITAGNMELTHHDFLNHTAADYITYAIHFIVFTDDLGRINEWAINHRWFGATNGVFEGVLATRRGPNHNGGYVIQDLAGSNFVQATSNVSGTWTSRSTEVPEPSTLAIFALGMIGLASRRFKKYA